MRIRRKIVLFLLLLVCFIVQGTFLKVIAIGSISPNLILIFVVSFGFMRGKKEGMFVGFFCGLLIDIFYGNMKEAIYNTASYFKYDYEDDWITNPFVREMIADVDQSTVLDSGVIDSPVLGKIPPTGLSGGIKTLILVKFESDKIFNASTCGDNCAKWLLKIAETEDRTINLRHLMRFGIEPFTIRILNTDQIVHSMDELVSVAGELI